MTAAFAAQGLRPEIVLSAMDADIIKTYVGLGLGVGLVASMAFDANLDHHLGSVDVADLFPRSTTGVAIHRSAYLPDFAYSFIEKVAPHLTRSVVDEAVDAPFRVPS